MLPSPRLQVFITAPEQDPANAFGYAHHNYALRACLCRMPAITSGRQTDMALTPFVHKELRARKSTVYVAAHGRLWLHIVDVSALLSHDIDLWCGGLGQCLHGHPAVRVHGHRLAMFGFSPHHLILFPTPHLD